MELHASHIRAACFGLLAGFALHSADPYGQWSWLAILSGSSVCLLFFVFGPGAERNEMRPYIFVIAVLVGLLRFEFSQSSFPTDLRPFVSDGLATKSYEVHAADRRDPRFWLYHWRLDLATRSDQLFTYDQSALIKGVLWGEKIQFYRLKTAMRNAGLSHLTAISGANVSWLIGLLVPALFLLGFGKRSAFVLGSITILVFAAFTGFGASIVRAAIMAWLVWFARMVGRPSNGKHLLLVTLSIYAWLEPWSLMFDPGLALSYLAMFGLMLVGQFDLDRPRSKFSGEVRQAILSTLAATIMTTPYILWAFDRANIFSILANLIVAPLIPWLMIAASLAIMFASPIWIALPAKGLADLVIRIATLTASIGSKQVTLSWSGMICIYLFLFYLQTRFSTHVVDQLRQASKAKWLKHMRLRQRIYNKNADLTHDLNELI